MSVLRIGTRGSPLARWQARAVAQALEASGGPPSETIIIRTTGDHVTDRPLAEMGGKRLFVKEIEEALLQERIDIAVHSAKDLPAELPEGLLIGATLRREDPRDALVARAHADGAPREPSEIMAAAGPAPRIGTGSVRRIAQLSTRYPSGRFMSIRGNVETRLRKLDADEYDLLVLATAGLVRLDLAHRVSARLPVDECLPAAGQGIVAIEIRASDDATRAALAPIADRDSMVALNAERALVKQLEGDCRVPIGAHAALDGDQVRLDAIVASLDGTRVLHQQAQGPTRDAAAVGTALAQRLLDDGADAILAEHR